MTRLESYEAGDSSLDNNRSGESTKGLPGFLRNGIYLQVLRLKRGVKVSWLSGWLSLWVCAFACVGWSAFWCLPGAWCCCPVGLLSGLAVWPCRLVSSSGPVSSLFLKRGDDSGHRPKDRSFERYPLCDRRTYGRCVIVVLLADSTVPFLSFSPILSLQWRRCGVLSVVCCGRCDFYFWLLSHASFPPAFLSLHDLFQALRRYRYRLLRQRLVFFTPSQALPFLHRASALVPKSEHDSSSEHIQMWITRSRNHYLQVRFLSVAGTARLETASLSTQLTVFTRLCRCQG